jgi:uncharacterized damage-inducible protein DinB
MFGSPDGDRMPDPMQFRLMAAYNRWMNGKVYDAAARLSDEERKRDLGAYFRSVHGTLNHLLWGDLMWMSRFDGGVKPNTRIDEPVHADFALLRRDREATDQRIATWADALKPEWLVQMLEWKSGIDGRTRRLPRWVVGTQLFNHQTHHRGQVTTLLKQLGQDPGETDIPWLPGLGTLVGGET